MRSNLLKVAISVAFGLAVFAAMGAAVHFTSSSWAPSLVSLIFVAIWIPLVRWWYRNEPQQAVDPRRQLRLFLAALAAFLAIGAAGVGAAVLMVPRSIDQLSPPCDLLPL